MIGCGSSFSVFSVSSRSASAVISGAQTTPQGEKLLEGARHKEVMDGDLKSAAEQSTLAHLLRIRRSDQSDLNSGRIATRRVLAHRDLNVRYW